MPALTRRFGKIHHLLAKLTILFNKNMKENNTLAVKSTTTTEGNTLSIDIPGVKIPEKAMLHKVKVYTTYLIEKFNKHFQIYKIKGAIIVPYSKGVVIEFSCEIANDTPTRFKKWVHLKRMESSIEKAFYELKLEIRNYLSDDLIKEYDDSSLNKDLFFGGTNILYTYNKFYIIKTYSNNQFGVEARKDFERIKGDFVELCKKPSIELTPTC